MSGGLRAGRRPERPGGLSGGSGAAQHDSDPSGRGLPSSAVHRSRRGVRADVGRWIADVRAADGARPVSWRAIVAVTLLIAGGLLELLAVLGICAMRDAYDRLHYLGLVSFGAFLIGVSIVVRESFSLIGDKALLVGVVLIVSGPIVAQTTARSLLIREHGDWRAQLADSEEVQDE